MLGSAQFPSFGLGFNIVQNAIDSDTILNQRISINERDSVQLTPMCDILIFQESSLAVISSLTLSLGNVNPEQQDQVALSM